MLALFQPSPILHSEPRHRPVFALGVEAGLSPAPAFGRVACRDQRQHQNAGKPLVDPDTLHAGQLFGKLGLKTFGPGESEPRALGRPEQRGQQGAQCDVGLWVLHLSPEAVESLCAQQRTQRYTQRVMELGVRRPARVEQVRSVPVAHETAYCSQRGDRDE